jgi:hypothetical protein
MSRNRRQNTNFAGGEGSSSPGLAQPGGAGEVDRNELRDAALGHRDAEQPAQSRSPFGGIVSQLESWSIQIDKSGLMWH